MQLDWTTFALEIINFLALVWILERFLYKPVLETLKLRRAGVQRTLTEAKEAEERATALQARFENRLAEWDKEKTAARAQLEAELSTERARQMQVLTKALAEEQERSGAREAHRREDVQRELEARAIAQGRRFTTALLARLASPELQTRLLDVFIEDFANLPEDQLIGLRGAVQTPAVRATVVSAFSLPEAQRQRITETLVARLGMSIPVEFGEDTALLAGLRVSVGPWQLGMALADELAYFATASNHVD